MGPPHFCETLGLPAGRRNSTMASEGEIEMTRLAGKVAIGTGGGSGMGRATVMRFLADGAKVIVADLNGNKGAETLAGTKAAGPPDRAARLRRAVSSGVNAAVAT